ncbi:MAG: hypothetical protein N3E41_08700 [Thermofilaceae archaeon]|nr:hypothetical protein [Thermofilaceae archaeon]
MLENGVFLLSILSQLHHKVFELMNIREGTDLSILSQLHPYTAFKHKEQAL